MRWAVYNESGKFLMEAEELGLITMLDLHRDAMERIKRDNKNGVTETDLHFSRGRWSGRKLTVKEVVCGTV